MAVEELLAKEAGETDDDAVTVLVRLLNAADRDRKELATSQARLVEVEARDVELLHVLGEHAKGNVQFHGSLVGEDVVELKAKLDDTESALAQAKQEGETDKRLVSAQQDYIDYLVEASQQTSVYLHVRNWKWPDSFLARGDALRTRLAALRPHGGQEKSP